MADITVKMITELRGITNAGMMDCKRALAETGGNMEEAIKILRLKGLAIQVKRADKEAKEGIVASAVSDCGCAYSLVEVNSETDFVAKTDNFKNFVAAVAKCALTGADPAEAMKDDLVALVSATGENVKIRRTAFFKKEATGKIEAYIHMGGKVGVLVEVACGKEETAASEAFASLVHDIALQVAAAAPRWVDRSQADPSVVESEMNLYRQQLAEQNKPAAMIENILKGKINKFYTDVCLVDQLFVKNGPGEKTTISQLMQKVAKETGDTISIKRFARFQLGAA